MKAKSTLFFIFIVLALSQDSENDAYNIGDPIKGSITDKGINSSYVFINVIPKPDSFLFFVVSLPLEEQWENVKFKVIDNQSKRVMVECLTKSIDECYLHSSQFVKEKLIVVVIECEELCSYNLQTYWTHVQKVIKDVPLNINFGKNGKAQLFQLNQDTLVKANELRVLVQPSTKGQISDRVKIYLNTNGTKPRFSNFEFESITLWEGGQGIFLKKQQFKNGKMMILVIGEAKIDYSLKCEVVEGKQHGLVSNKVYNDYISGGQPRIYRVNLQQNLSKLKSEKLYSLKFSIFTGQLLIGLYTDKECTISFESKPFAYIGTSKYTLSSNTLKEKKITILYIKLQSRNGGPVTFSSQFYAEKLINSAQLQHGQYLFRSVPHQQLFYFHFREWYNPENPEPTKFVVTTFQLNDQSSPLSFRTCDSQLNECTNLNNYLKHTTQIEKVSTSTTSTGISYTIELDSKKYKELTSMGKQGTIVVQINPSIKTKSSFVAIFFTDNNIIEMLSEEKIVSNSISEGSAKYYLFHNQNKQIKSIAFHLSETSGQANIQAFRKDPRRDTTVQPILSNKHTIIIKDQLTRPIYILITAQTQVSYFLSTSTSTDDSKTIVKSNPNNVQVLEISSKKDYVLTLRPGENKILKLAPTEDKLWFNYKASGNVGFCKIQHPQEQCENQIPFIGNKIESLLETKDPKTPIFVRIMSIKAKRTLEVIVNYFSDSQNKQGVDNMLCVQKEVGKVYSDILKSNVCLKFVLDKLQDFRGIFLRTEMFHMLFGGELCGTMLALQSVVFETTKKTIEQFCQGKQQRQLKIYLKPTLQNDLSMKVQYIVQYTNDILYLPEGIAHTENVIGKYGAIKKYYFRVLNKVDTQIKLHFKKGSVSAYLKVVDESEAQKTFVSAQVFEISTQKSKFFSSDPIAKIPAAFINSKQCTKCVLVIVIYTNDNIVGNQISYSIEVLQGGSQQLQEHQLRHNFLPKGSIAYYKYDCQQSAKSLVFDVQDNNMDCAKLFIGEQQFPSQQQNEGIVLGNTLTSLCSKKTHYFAVEALSDCPLSVSAQSSSFNLTKISSGIPITVDIEAGNLSYFVLPHYSDSNFKLFVIEESGSSKIYMNMITEKILEQLQKNLLNLEEFEIKSQHKNQIEVLNTTKGFCKTCNYLAVIKAETPLKGATIILVENKEKIIMHPDKVLYDELQTSQTTQLHYFNALKGYVYVNVFKSNVVVTVSLNDKTVEKYISSQDKSINVISYNFITNNKDYDWRPVVVKIFNQGSQLAVYTLHLTKDNDPEINAQIIKEGLPAYVSDFQKCVRGFFTDQKLILYLSVQEDKETILQGLDLKLKINNQQRSIVKNIISNNMEIIYTKQPTDSPSQQYVFCIENLKPNRQQKLSVIQSSDINLLALNTWTIVSSQKSFLIHPTEQFLLDVFACRGSVKYQYFDNYEDLQKQSALTEMVDSSEGQSIEIQKNHAVYIQSTDDIGFLKLVSDSSVVKWMEVDRTKELGVGYLKYQAGKLDWDYNTSQIILKWKPLSPVQTTNTKLYLTTYRLFVTTDLEQIKSQSNCEINKSNNKIHEVVITEKQSSIAINTITLKKLDLQEKFAKQLTKHDDTHLNFIVIADAQIRVPMSQNTKDQKLNVYEDYRFMYVPLKLPIEAIKNDFVYVNINKAPPSILYYIVAASIVIASVGFLVFLVMKKLVPLLNRLKGGDMELAQEKNQKETSSKPTEQQIMREMDN